ncbi:MAG TPA: hypothetical protein VIL71_12105 [Spirillospora sp.]
MNPQWPGQPPGGPGLPGPPPPPGGPGIPPPHKSGGGALVPLLIFGLAGILAVVGIGAYVLLNEDDDDTDSRSAAPIYTPEAPSTPPSVPTPEPTQSTGGTSGVASVLGPAIRTAKGNTFTRAGSRTASCTSRANARLASALRQSPCVGPMYSAVYADPTKKIITVLSIAQFSSPSDAAAVSRVTADKGWPELLLPSDESGLPQPSDPPFWTRSWTQGSNVVYAQSYWANGAPTGGRSGSVFATAGELGVEITNVLIWTD